MRNVFSLASGLLLGLGLMVSDMVNPARVLGFLDVSGMADGTWDPTLMFVMGGAMALSALAWLISYRRARTLLGGQIPPMPAQGIDLRLIGGSAIFGVGWGLVGICPGPAVVGFTLGGSATAIFLVSMIAGMAVFAAFDARLRRAHA